MRVVFDTNVWIAAVTSRGAAFALKERLQTEGSPLVISPFIMEEAERVLSSKKFLMPPAGVAGVLQYLRDVCVIVYPESVPKVVEEDPDDDHILACAREGKADTVVSGDAALVAIGIWEGIRIITIRELLDELS